MKKVFFISIFIVFLANACATFENATIYDRKVRYFSSTILDAERNVIRLANQSVWQIDHLTAIVNLSPVFVVLEENINTGYLFVGNQKYGIHGGIAEDFFFQYGYLQIMKNYDSTKSVITLLNNSRWFVPPQFGKILKKWVNGSEVVITESENFIINARRREKVPVRRIYNFEKH